MAASRTYPVRAIVLGRTKMGETDLVLTLLADDGRRLRAVAKGARKPQGKLAGKVQLFSQGRFLMARGRSLDVVAEATLVDAHRATANSLDGVAAASAVCEVARLACYEDVEDPFLFPLLAKTLALADAASVRQGADGPATELDLLAAAYTFKVLSHHGWLPEVGACVECGDPAVSWFSPVAGGALCESCARDVPGAEPADPAALAWIGALVGLTYEQLLAQVPDPATVRWLLGRAHLWAATHLEARLRAFEFLLGL